jgi:hypothetical protein
MVSGFDRYWVSGTFDKIDNIVKAVTPQQHWFVKYKTIILHIGSLILGYMIFEITSMFFDIIHGPVKPIENPSETLLVIRNFVQMYPLVLQIFNGIIFWLDGIFPTLLLRDWVLKLWPKVEFDFGPEHQKLEKIRRKRLGLFFLLIVIPFLINFIYDLVKK